MATKSMTQIKPVYKDVMDIFEDVGGCVYIVEFEKIDAVKIGFSTNLYERLSSFSTYAPFGIGRIFYKETKSYQKIEREMHRHFNDCRLNGEWFSCDFDCAVDKLKSILQSDFCFDEEKSNSENIVINYLRMQNFFNRIDLTRKMAQRDPELDYMAECALAEAYWFKQGKDQEWIHQWFIYTDSRRKLIDLIVERCRDFNSCDEVMSSIHRNLFGFVVLNPQDKTLSVRDMLLSRVNVEGYEMESLALINYAQVLLKNKIKNDDLYGKDQCLMACSQSCKKVAQVL